MLPLEVVVVDDEPVAVRRLASLLRGLDAVEVVGTAGNADEAIALIDDRTPDVVLLDIEMPGLNGVQLAERLRGMAEPPAIVFVTAFSRFAVEAFDLQAAHYILKPVEPPRLAEAIERVRRHVVNRLNAERMSGMEDVVRQLRALERAERPEDDALWLPDGHSQERVPIRDITWIEAERDYVRVHTARRSYFLRGRLGEMEARLADAGVVRVHRSAMVRAAAVNRVEPHGERGYRLILTDGTVVEASRRFGARVRALATPQP